MILMSESQSRKRTHNVEPAARRNESWMKIDLSHSRFHLFIRFVSWSIDCCSAKRVLKPRVNCHAGGCKWITKQFYSNGYHTGITAELHAVVASVVNFRLTFHRATTLRIGHRKLQKGLHVQSKTIFIFFTTFLVFFLTF